MITISPDYDHEGKERGLCYLFVNSADDKNGTGKFGYSVNIGTYSIFKKLKNHRYCALLRISAAITV